ncbi:MAG: prepilin peptidase [Hyphomonadaceae bacterium]|nr:prepilin peptidase [Hyphomonadaceae bacterium]
MPVETLIASACLALFVGLVLFAALSDIATMTIPNWVSIAAVVLFPLAATLAGLTPAQIGLHLGVGVVMFFIGFLLFNIGILGGGDVKVIAAVSVWTGLGALSSFAFAMTLAGGGLALLIIIARRAAKPSDAAPAFVNRLLKPQNGIPYAVAIAIGVIASLPLQPVFKALGA